MITRPGLAALAVAATLALAACTGDADAGENQPTDDASGATASPGAAESGHVDNPFAGATMYVNEVWADQAEATADDYEDDDPELAAAMREVATQPTAVWMDRTSAIDGNADGPGLRHHLDAALEQRDGDTPMTVTVVIYNLPGRDCFALASNGELPATDEGLERYQSEYIDPIAAMFAEDKYAGLRIVTVLEPDSLPNLVTNASEPKCAEADPYYRAGVAYALDAFAPLENVYAYIDAAHSGWLGWDTNAGPTAQLFADVVRSTDAGFDAVDGFVTNTANTTPTEEPFLPNPEAQVGGQPLRQSDFYEFNAVFDEADWTADLYSRLIGAGFPEHIGMIIDTSRNGWGGPERPTSLTAAGSLEAYIDANRVDRRPHRGAWCNQDGAGLGLRPQALPSGFPASHLDAYLWVKPPGESDGSSTEIPNDEGKSFDRMCDPTFTTERLAGNATNALPDAPVSGKWFAAQFAQLVANAYPPVGEDNPPARTEPGADQPIGSASDDGSGDDGGDDSGSGDSGDDAAGPDLGDLDPSVACSATLDVVNEWDGGFQVDVTVVAHRDISGWELAFTLPSGTAIADLWNGDNSGTTGSVTVGDVGWNGTLARGETGEFGFTGTGAAPSESLPIACSD